VPTGDTVDDSVIVHFGNRDVRTDAAGNLLNANVPGVPHGGTFDYHWNTWFDEGCSRHTVLSVNAPAVRHVDPSAQQSGPAPPTGFSRQFTTVGHFAYQCGVHLGDPIRAVGGAGGNPAGPGVDSPARSMWGIVHVIP
jgi:hypothetical protein